MNNTHGYQLHWHFYQNNKDSSKSECKTYNYVKSSMQLVRFNIFFQMNYKIELMTHISKRKEKKSNKSWTRNSVCKRSSHLHSPHRISHRSISKPYEIYANPKPTKPNEKSECFGLIIIDLICIPLDNDDDDDDYSDGMRFHFSWILMRLFLFEQYEWPSTTTTTTATVAATERMQRDI